HLLVPAPALGGTNIALQLSPSSPSAPSPSSGPVMSAAAVAPPSAGAVAVAGAASSVDASSLPPSSRSASLLPLKLSQLQNLCKRDPPAHRDDYDAQFRRLESSARILRLSPDGASSAPEAGLVELIQFCAAVSAGCYRGEASDKVAGLLMGLLAGNDGAGYVATARQRQQHKSTTVRLETTLPSAALRLHRDVRKACVSALILMRNKGVVPPLRLLHLFFQLMAVIPDKNLRECLYHHVVNDIRNINKKGKRDDKLNREVQSFFHRVVAASAEGAIPGGEDTPADYAAKRATQATCDLYRRGAWTDARAVHVLAAAAASPNSSVTARALRFFLNVEEEMAWDKRNSEDAEWAGKNEIDLHLHSKKTKARRRMVAKQIKNRMKKQHEREGQLAAQREDRGVEGSRKLFPAIELLHDPQGLCETILKRVKSSGSNRYKFEVKLLMLNFVTRCAGNHELLLLPLYPLLRRYMGGHQRDVTAILAYAVQACHPGVPPDEVREVLKTIVHQFVTERCTGEMMAVGINACRAICARVPSVLSTEEDDNGDVDGGEGAAGGGGSVSWDVEAFARDLASYAKHRDRSVSIAGRGWVNFVREAHPALLRGRDRGLVGAGLNKAGERPLRYGEVRAASGVEGAELLAAYEASRKRKNPEGGGADDDEGSEGGDAGEDGWEEVASDDEEDELKLEDENEEGGESDDEAPDLTLLGEEGDGDDGEDAKPKVGGEADGEDEKQLDLAQLSEKDRAKLQQEVSSTRIFSASEFAKMQKLVDRQKRARRDPRLAARLRRAKAKGEEFADLSDDENESDSDEEDDDVHVKGAVRATDIMADAKRKRMSKAEKLEKIIEGREKWESKVRIAFLFGRYAPWRWLSVACEDLACRSSLNDQV
ncbi:hypothetical protein ACHAWF_016956, partial [Thalassiosira exigua]